MCVPCWHILTHFQIKISNNKLISSPNLRPGRVLLPHGPPLPSLLHPRPLSWQRPSESLPRIITASPWLTSEAHSLHLAIGRVRAVQLSQLVSPPLRNLWGPLTIPALIPHLCSQQLPTAWPPKARDSVPFAMHQITPCSL